MDGSIKRFTAMPAKEKTQFLLVLSMLGYDRVTINAKMLGGKDVFVFKFDKTKKENDLLLQTPHFEFVNGQSEDFAKYALKTLFQDIDKHVLKTGIKLKDEYTKQISEIVDYEASYIDITKLSIKDLFEGMLLQQTKCGINKDQEKQYQTAIDKFRFVASELDLDNTVIDWFEYNVGTAPNDRSQVYYPEL